MFLLIVLYVACICLFKFVKQTVSSSTKIKFPTPALAKASTVKLPTPPTPNTITLLFANLSKASLPISNSVLDNECCNIKFLSFLS